MQPAVYTVDSRMVPPVVLAMGFGIVLLAMEGVTQRGGLLLAILAPFFYLGVEILARKISLDSKGLTVNKFLRSVNVIWSEIDSADAFRSGRKSFLILQRADGGPVLITNTIRPFGELVQRILDSLPSEKVSEAAREMAGDPAGKWGPLLQAWVICLMLGGTAVGRLLGYG